MKTVFYVSTRQLLLYALISLFTGLAIGEYTRRLMMGNKYSLEQTGKAELMVILLQYNGDSVK